MAELKTIQNEQEAEKALKRIAEIDLKISTANNNAEELIQQAKEQAQKSTKTLSQKREDLIESLKIFSNEHREEVYEEGKKSRDFVNGTIGYRQSPDKIEVSKETAELLEKAGFNHCIKIKKEPVKAALKGFSEEQLAGFKATRVKGIENFFVKVTTPTVKTKNAA